jgi:dihydrofolate reductase/thymidylate synthase
MEIELTYVSNAQEIMGIKVLSQEKLVDTMPWTIKEDLNLFRSITSYSPYPNKKNVVIMGRGTWESMSSPLKDRINVVISSKSTTADYTAKTYHEALVWCNSQNIYKIFVIGGARLWKEAMEYGTVTRIYQTDTSTPISENAVEVSFLPEEICPDNLSKKYNLINTVTKNNCTFNTWEIKTLPFEIQFLSLLKKIYTQGENVEGRNGGVRSVKGSFLKFDLQEGFPILTVKKTFFRGIVEELLWMIRGDTNVKNLQAKNIHIWDGNSSRAYLDSRGLTDYEEGETGPIYGFQMRFFGAEYKGPNDDYTGLGIDQLKNCIHLLKTEPTSRRIIINLWNVEDLDRMALVPCHFCYQFTVSNGRLNCHLSQRSWDILLGWNPSTAALLTHILAKECGFEVGEVSIHIGDVHIYHTHIHAIDEILSRVPHKLPKLVIKDYTSWEELDANQFSLDSYVYHEIIKLHMSA